MDEQLLIEKNQAWIWKQVHAFSRSQSGYGSIRYDKDDLFQECVAYLLKKFRRSGLSVDDFKVSDLDLRHVMCEYVQSLLPVKVPKTARNYTKTMTKYRSDAEDEPQKKSVDMHARVSVMEDSEFLSDVERMKRSLDARDARVLELVLRGYSWSDISRMTGISKVSLVRTKDRIGRSYNCFMRESHGKAKRQA